MLRHLVPLGLRHLRGVIPHHDDHGMDVGGHSEHAHTGSHSHSTEGWGDTVFGPEIRLAEGPGYHLHVSPMVSAPTGRVDYQRRVHPLRHAAGLRHLGLLAEHHQYRPRRPLDLGGRGARHYLL